MPLYVGDYLADTMHLEAAEHGAYLLLIMHYWRNGPLPTDDAALAAIARMPRQKWRGHTRQIVLEFFVEHEGRLHHKRVDRERDKVGLISEKRREAGLAGASARYGKPIANATDLPKQTHRPLPLPLPKVQIPTGSSRPSDDATAPIEVEKGSVEEAVKAWNAVAGKKLPKVTVLTDGRRKVLRARLDEHFGGDIHQWVEFIRRILRSPFLTGGSERGWTADLDWCLKPANLAKILDGNYDPKHAANPLYEESPNSL